MVEAAAEGAGDNKEALLKVPAGNLQSKLEIRKVFGRGVTVYGDTLLLCPVPAVSVGAVGIADEPMGKKPGLMTGINAPVDGP